MTNTSSNEPRTVSAEESHGESHASMSDRKSRRKSRVDTTSEFMQVRKSHEPAQEVTRPLPRKVTFSGLPLGRPERDSERGEINKNPVRDGDPEPVGPLAEALLDDLAARQAEALNRLRRQQPAIRRRKDQP